MNKSYFKLLGILLVLFESILAQTDYVFKRFSLDQIDTVFLSSISSSAAYIIELRDSTAPNKIKNAQNLLYHKEYVYIGAENWLLKINSKTFKIEQSIRYGPLYDSAFCRYSPIDECLYGHQKTLTNNQNKLLLIYEEKNLLLSCWSARQGICDLRDLDDLNNVVLNSSIAAVANDPLNSTLGFIASSANSQDVLYIAATYNNNGPYRTDVPALSGRSLQSNHKFMQIISSNSQGLKSSKASIEFMSRFMKTFIVKYVDAFNLGIYNYFLTVQHSDTDSLLRGDLLMSKISRLCLNDLSFTKSYTEMPIECVGSNSANSLRPIDYNELISSKYIEINSKHYLIGLFQHTRRNSFNSSMDLAFSKQAVCVFKMDDVQRKFRDNINKCYNTDVMRGLNFIKPDQKCLAKKFRFNAANEYIDDDFCSSAENGLYPIGGTIPIRSSAVLQFENKFYDSVTLFESQIINTMILKSEKKSTVNFYDMNQMRLYRNVQISSDSGDYLPKVKDISLDGTGSVYVLNKNELVKLSMFNCDRYLSCGECIGQSIVDEPYCGWCSSSNQCSSRSECPSDKWLNANSMNVTSSNGIESVCVDIERVEPKLVHVRTQEWIHVEFRKELSLVSNDNYSCVFVNNKYDLETRAVKINKNQLKCPMPHSTLIEKFYEPVKSQKLVLADDGIFKVAQNNNFESTLDRINLGFYIKNSDFKYGWSNSAPLYNLTVINCDMHKSCVSCVASHDKCSWCNGKCKRKESNQSCTNDVDSCSSFDPATNKLLIPFTAHRQQAPLTFTLRNIEHVTNIECLITYRDGMALDRVIQVPFKAINKTHSSCVLSDIFSQLESYLTNGQVQTNLRLFNGDYFIDSPSNGKLTLMFYKCEQKANDCSSCLSINRQLSCMWCSGSCRFMNPHSKLAVLSQCIGPSNAFLVNNSNLNQCHKPQITSISPLKVPYSGGSILTIDGVNLGASFDDLLSVNLKCGQSSNECDLLASKYTTSKQIGCKLRPFATSSNECSVSVRLRTNIVISGSNSVQLSNGLMSLLVKASQLVVKLVDPIITSVTPAQVIQSANFVWLTINGIDLDSGRNRQLQIIDNVNDFKQRIVKCDIKNVTSQSIRCRLNEKFSSLGKKNLRLVIDEYTSINTNLKVNSDPLVKSIDNSISFYAGGVTFELTGFNFDSVQSAYTFVNYRDMWYSEPVSARHRISNDRIVFETPPLSDAFFALTKPEDGSRYLLQVGFLMDGFNVTLKDQYISYVPNLEANSLAPVSLDLVKLNDLYTIKMSVRIEPSVAQYHELIKRNIQLYVGCSLCHQSQWSEHHTDFACTLPPLVKSRQQTNDKSCQSRVFDTLLSDLNSHGHLSMVNLFVGNSRFQIDPTLLRENKNLELYIQSYQLNNVDNFIHTVKQLEQQSVRTATLRDILDKYDSFTNESNAPLNATPGLMSNRNLFILSAIIASIVLILILVTLSLSSYVIKLKSTRPMYKLGCKRRGRIEFDLIQKQIDQLELSIRPKCSQLYQQLHNDYLNELNNDLIYTLNGLPVWNYKTYLYAYIFPCRHKLDLIYSPLNLVMSSSSMSNSTTNTLLSTHTPPVQNLKQNMSVYATIKSSSMLRFDEDNSSNRQQFVSYGNIGEAMLLFDQLIHNKSFLITFVGVCESQRDTFGGKERHNFSSLITLALKDNLHYLYSIIKSLLAEHIRECLSSKKSIFGANDNLVEPMLNNFIAMFMYDYQRDSQTALHLYRLVKSIKSYIKMAPCDQVKQLSLNSLSEDTLLSDNSLIGPYQTIYVNVMLNANILSAANGKNLFLVALIDTDTVQQAKEKIVDSVFKRTNMSLFNLAAAPSTSDLDLELCLILIQGNETNQTTLITLKETEDELVVNSDSLAASSGKPLKRLLTLKEYNIQNGSFINLNIKSNLLVQNKDNHVYMSTMSMSNEYVLYASKPATTVNETQRYHLIKPNDNYTSSNASSLHVKKKKMKKYEKLLTVKSQDSSVTTDSLIKHVDNPINHLSRLLMNKGTIQPFIDQFVESIFSNSSSLPPVITNLFEFIDCEIKKSNLKSDESNKIAKMCKVNVYFVRYWVNMIKNPDLIMDCDKSMLIDSSLSCIAQAFLDSCSSSDVHNLYDTNSPLNRLLFIREVPKYKEMIDAFFADLKSMPTTSEHEMHFYLSEFSKCKNFELQNQVMGATVNSQMSQSAQPELNSVQVLLQLYEYYEKYQHQINTALGQQQCSVLLPVHHRLVQIKDLMSMSTMATNQTLNRNTALFANNPYQQINANYQGVNCYAATSDLIVSYPTMNTSVQPVNTLPHLRNQFQPIQQQQQQQFF